jgi:hypothetical protein
MLFTRARLYSAHTIRSSRLGSCYLLDLTWLMLFARLDSAHVIRSTQLDLTRLMLRDRLDSAHAIRSN